MTTKRIYDPIQFIGEIEIFTIAMLCSFITWKLLNSLYDNLYEPAIELFINLGDSEKYYIKIGNYYINIGIVFKELIKWIILLVVIMILYNVIVRT